MSQNNQALLYIKQTGEIQCVLSGERSGDYSYYANAEKGVVSIPAGSVVAIDGKWVENGVVKDATAVQIAVSTKTPKIGETVTFSGLPNPCWIVNTATGATIRVTATTYSTTLTEGGWLAIRLQGKYSGEASVFFDALSDMKEKAKVIVDQGAEAARARVVTPGSGQAMTYIRKAEAAQQYLAGVTLVGAQLQRLTDEAARLNVTVAEAAQTLADTANLWESIDATIDNLRLVAKKNIDAATTGQAVEGFSKVNWPI